MTTASSNRATHALNVPDIITSILSFIDIPSFQLQFASINRCCYKTCAAPRVRLVKLKDTPVKSKLWPFLKFIRRWKIAGQCRSLKIDGTKDPINLCLASLIFKEIGDSKHQQLQHLSVVATREGAGINDRPGVQTITPLNEVILDFERVVEGQSVLDDDIFEEMQRVVGDSRFAIDDQYPKLWRELSKIASVEELSVGMPRQTWSSFYHSDAVHDNLRTLNLQFSISSDPNPQMPVNPTSIPNSFQRLETLKLVSYFGSEPVPIFHLTFPCLRTFEIGSFDSVPVDPNILSDEGTLVRFTHFIERHPLLQTVSLGERFVVSAGRILRSAVNLRGLRLAMQYAMVVVNVPDSLGAIPHLTHLRYTGMSVGVILKRLKHSPAIPKLPHFRCIEFNCGTVTGLEGMMKPTIAHGTGFRLAHLCDIFPNLIELALIVPLFYAHVDDVLPTILDRLRGCANLVALRLCNSGTFNDLALLKSTMEKMHAMPPKLRYVVWEKGSSKRTYELTSVGNPAQGIQVTKIPPLRSTPAKGRWSTDWYEESVFDHITGD